MVFTFLAARGLPTGSSLVESSKVDMARDLEASAKQRGVQILLPSDVVVAQSFPSDACPKPEHRVVAADAIPDGWMVSTVMFQGALALPASSKLRMQSIPEQGAATVCAAHASTKGLGSNGPGIAGSNQGRVCPQRHHA